MRKNINLILADRYLIAGFLKLTVKDRNWVKGHRYDINGTTTCQEEYHYVDQKPSSIGVGEILVSILLALILIILVTLLVVYCLKSRGMILKKPLPFSVHYEPEPEGVGDIWAPLFPPPVMQQTQNGTNVRLIRAHNFM